MSGWNLPPGCKTLPGEEEYPDWPLKCRHCGAFVKYEPDTQVVDEWEDVEYDPTTQTTRRVAMKESKPAHTCKRCGRVTLNEYYY